MATSQSVLHHDVLLSNYVQHWTPPEKEEGIDWFLHDDLFPIVPVDKASNVFKVINQATFMQTARAIVGAKGDVSTVQAYYDPEGNYVVRPYALDGVIDYRERAIADDVAMYEQLTTDLPMRILMNTLEVDAYTEVLTQANLGSNFEICGADDMFDNYASMTGNPLLYIRKKCEKVMNITGRKPKLVIIDRLVLRALKFHPAVQMIAPVHTVPAGLQEITLKMIEEKLSDVLNPGSLRIAHFRYDSSNTPKAQSVLSPKSAIGPNLIIAYAEETSRQDTSATKQFAFTGNMDVQGSRLTGETHDASAPLAAYTYPIYASGQMGGMGIRVITNRVFKVVRPSSLFVSFGVVDKNNAANYGSELL
jgi:hypothetical protein